MAEGSYRVIRVKRIYNFLLIHVSFVMLSNVSTIILHHFVVVVNRQMPWDGLSWGRMDAGGTGEGLWVELHTQTDAGFTQVQGPRVEVKPLPLLV